jgi:RNA polymerase sigma-B factor
MTKPIRTTTSPTPARTDGARPQGPARVDGPRAPVTRTAKPRASRPAAADTPRPEGPEDATEALRTEGTGRRSGEPSPEGADGAPTPRAPDGAGHKVVPTTLDAEAARARVELRLRFEQYRRTRDRALRNQLIEEHRSLAIRLARRFAQRSEPLDDLVQVAMLGVLKAVERFEPDRNLEFSTFATPTVLGELKRHFRDTTWMVRVPRKAQELHLQVGTAIGALLQRNGRNPTVAELAAELHATEDEVIEAMEVGAAYRATSFDGPRREDQASSPEDTYLRTDDPGYESTDHRDLLSDLLQRLPERERYIVQLRFVDELTQSEIAQRVGVSQMQVSRLLRRSLAQLRERALRSLEV